MAVVYILIIKFKKNDSFCASFCSYVIHLTKVLGKDFKCAVSNLYYQQFLEFK